jgi:hypothetical protein
MWSVEGSWQGKGGTHKKENHMKNHLETSSGLGIQLAPQPGSENTEESSKESKRRFNSSFSTYGGKIEREKKKRKEERKQREETEERREKRDVAKQRRAEKRGMGDLCPTKSRRQQGSRLRS